ncbi:MAG: hypothetical protein AABM66_11480 [Actinomycetota bacterium]
MSDGLALAVIQLLTAVRGLGGGLRGGGGVPWGVLIVIAIVLVGAAIS